MSKRRDIHDRVLQATNADELASVYAEWADNYDTDLVDEMGYQAHRDVAEMLHATLGHAACRVLDAGCGTGLVGIELKRLGYQNIDGLDYSQAMLDVAAGKGLYQVLMQGDLMGLLDVATDHYDAVTCVGTFTLGHVGPNAFRELIRITRPGGYLCFSVRSEAWDEHDYASSIDALEKEGSWRLLDERTSTYIEEEHSSCHICLCQVAPG